MYLLIFLFAVASIVLAVGALWRKPEFKPIISVVPLNENLAYAKKRPMVFKFFFFLFPFNKFVVDKIGRIRLEDRLIAANVPLLPEDFITLKEILLLLSFFIVLAFKDLFVPRQLLWAGIFVALSIIGPDLWLKSRLKRRQKMVIKTLPEVIDLLTMCVNAGLDFSVAVKWVVEKSRPDPLIEELGIFLLETKVGKSRKQALQDMARRIDLPEMHSFARSLVQAERLGTPVESALAILAEEVRDFRFRRGERLALQAPIKMLLPLIFFIMPVVGIMVGGPILIQFMQGGIPGFK